MRGKYMINISFGKWFLENDTFTISLFNNSINEAKKMGGEGFLDESSLEHYEKEIKYRIKQFADRLKDKEKIKQIVPSSILEDLAKQKKITINELIENIHDAANKYDKNQDEIKYTSFLQNLHIHKMHPSGSNALETSLFQKIKSKTKPNYIYRSINTVDKIIDNDKSELKNPPENPKIGDKHEDQGNTWKFMSDKTWRKIRLGTKEYEGTELLNMFNRSKLDRPMLKAILHYYDNDYFNEKEVMKAFEGSCKYIGRNQLKKDIGKDAMVKADPYKGDKTKIFERAKIKFPNPEIDNVYEDEETNTTWNWVYSKKTKGMGWKEKLKEKPISHFSLYNKDGEIEYDPEGREKEGNPLDLDSDYTSKEYDDETESKEHDAEIKRYGGSETTKPIENPQKKPIIDQEKPEEINDSKSFMTNFKNHIRSTNTLKNDNDQSKCTYYYMFYNKDDIKKAQLEKRSLIKTVKVNDQITNFYRKLFIDFTDELIKQLDKGKMINNLLGERGNMLIPFLELKAAEIPENFGKPILWARCTAEKYKDELAYFAQQKNYIVGATNRGKKF